MRFLKLSTYYYFSYSKWREVKAKPNTDARANNDQSPSLKFAHLIIPLAFELSAYWRRVCHTRPDSRRIGDSQYAGS